MERSKTTLPEVKQHYGKLKNYINGEWVDSASTKILDVVNPATATAIARVPLSTPEEVRTAIQAAKGAFWEWRETPPLIRARYMFRLKDLMEERRAEGLLLVTAKSCNPAHHDSTCIAKMCEQNGIPYLSFEFEEDQRVFESIRVVLEALMEARRRLPYAGTENGGVKVT